MLVEMVMKMWLRAPGILLLFLHVNHTVAKDMRSNISMRDAIQSMTHIVEDNGEKLERLAAIERQLDQYMKLAQATLDNKVSIVDTFATHFAKIDDKISGFELLLSQRDERERIQIQKTAVMIENLENRLETRLSEIKNSITEVNQRVEATEPTTTTESVTASDIIFKLNDAEKHFLEKVAVIESRLNSIVTKNKDDVTKESENLGNIFTEVQNITGRLADIESSLEKVREDAKKEAEKPVEEPIDIGAIIEKQTKALGKVTDLVVNTMNRMEDMPRTSVVLALHNETQSALQEVKSTLQIAVEDRLDGLIKNVSGNNEDIKDSIGHLRSDLANNTEHVNAKLRDIANAQMVMVSTANSVQDIKRRLEFGLLQILLDVGELVNGTGTVLNTTLNDRFDRLSKAIGNSTNILEQELEMVQNITGRLADIESSLEKVREDAKKESEKPVEEPIDIKAIIEKQTKALGKVTDLVVNTMNGMEDMPRTSVVLALHNETQSALQEAKSTLQIAVEDRLNGLIKNVSGNNEDIKDSIGHLRSDLANNTEHVNAKLRDIANAQMVMVLTANSVQDIKRRLEFGLLQILSDVGELVNGTGTVLNTTLNDRFDRLSKAIGNSTNILEQELEMVWRHINTMQVQSTQTLEKLNKQNEAHANGIISTMDGMENKVGDMTKRMSEVDDNLNYLLGRLSLMSQEFTRIKSGLVTALDDIKASFKEVQEKAKDLSIPGRHPLPENHVVWTRLFGDRPAN